MTGPSTPTSEEMTDLEAICRRLEDGGERELDRILFRQHQHASTAPARDPVHAWHAFLRSHQHILRRGSGNDSVAGRLIQLLGQEPQHRRPSGALAAETLSRATDQRLRLESAGDDPRPPEDVLFIDALQVQPFNEDQLVVTARHGLEGNHLAVWDIGSGAQIWTIRLCGGEKIIAARTGTAIIVWRADRCYLDVVHEQGETTEVQTGGPLANVAMADDGSRAVTVTRDGRMDVWRLDQPGLETTLDVPLAQPPTGTISTFGWMPTTLAISPWGWVYLFAPLEQKPLSNAHASSGGSEGDRLKPMALSCIDIETGRVLSQQIPSPVESLHGTRFLCDPLAAVCSGDAYRIDPDSGIWQPVTPPEFDDQMLLAGKQAYWAAVGGGFNNPLRPADRRLGVSAFEKPHEGLRGLAWGATCTSHYVVTSISLKGGPQWKRYRAHKLAPYTPSHQTSPAGTAGTEADLLQRVREGAPWSEMRGTLHIPLPGGREVVADQERIELLGGRTPSSWQNFVRAHWPRPFDPDAMDPVDERGQPIRSLVGCANPDGTEVTILFRVTLPVDYDGDRFQNIWLLRLPIGEEPPPILHAFPEDPVKGCQPAHMGASGNVVAGTSNGLLLFPRDPALSQPRAFRLVDGLSQTTGPVREIMSLGDDRRVLVRCESSVFIWDCVEGQLLTALSPVGETPTAAFLSPCRSKAAIATHTGYLRVHELQHADSHDNQHSAVTCWLADAPIVEGGFIDEQSIVLKTDEGHHMTLTLVQEAIV